MSWLLLVYVFPLPWLLGFLLHEFCHCLEAMRQGSEQCSIKIWKFAAIPSFFADAEQVKNEGLFKLAGGLYSGLLLLPLAIIGLFTCKVIGFSFLTVSIANLVYSVYEYKLLWKIDFELYMIGHYLLYLSIIVLMFAFWFLVIL